VIELFVGENSFEIKCAVAERADVFDGEAEYIDGATMELPALSDLFMGVTLFAEKRLVIISELSSNKQLWSQLTEWVSRASDETSIILIEPKPDKRTKTYKELVKRANVIEYAAWTDRDVYKAEQWVADEARRQQIAIDKKSIQELVSRVGVDQWQLFHSLQKLAVFDTITLDLITDVIDATPSENVFNLFESALRGDYEKVRHMLTTLKITEDPYMVFGLLSAQAFQLAILTVSDVPPQQVAKDIGAHPFALQKLSSHAGRIGKSGAKTIVTAFADADYLLKSTTTDPWVVVERALLSTIETK
jgi:DNA polymerase-3 subunit delta